MLNGLILKLRNILKIIRILVKNLFDFRYKCNAANSYSDFTVSIFCKFRKLSKKFPEVNSQYKNSFLSLRKLNNEMKVVNNGKESKLKK